MLLTSMEKAIGEILAHIDILLAENKDYGRKVAHDLLSNLAEKMEKLAAERAQLDIKLATAGSDSESRSAIVEEIAAKLEKIAGRARWTKELIDSIIDRLYSLSPDQREKIANAK